VQTILELHNLTKYFAHRGTSGSAISMTEAPEVTVSPAGKKTGKPSSTRRSLVHAVDGVTFSVRKGENLGLVGESGCGKTTLCRCIVHLEEPTGGRIIFEGKDILRLRGGEIRKMRQRMQYVFQNPRNALTPRMKIRTMLEEPLRNFKLIHGKTELQSRLGELLDLVGLNKEVLDQRPS